MRHITSLGLVLLLTAFPLLTTAQVEENLHVEAQNEPVITSPAPPEPSPVAEESPLQESVSSDVLEGSLNPQEDTALGEAIEVIDMATEERLEVEAEEVAPTSIVIDLATTTEEVIGILPEATTTKVAQLNEEDLKPKKEYTFDINGAAIATDAVPDWSSPESPKKEEGGEVTVAPVVDLDTPHELTVSGECTDAYYVVLIYKDREGYDTNPSSYIYNRAYPCGNGHYSYALSELPFSLESGTFYLLLAGQGNTGPWKPISALLPIGITVKTILPEASSTLTHEPI